MILLLEFRTVTVLTRVVFTGYGEASYYVGFISNFALDVNVRTAHYLMRATIPKYVSDEYYLTSQPPFPYNVSTVILLLEFPDCYYAN